MQRYFLQRIALARNLSSILSATNAKYMEWMYQSWLANPSCIQDQKLQKYFEGLSVKAQPSQKSQQFALFKQAFEQYGHLIAKLDPLNRIEEALPYELDYQNYGFSDGDLEKTYQINDQLGSMKLKEFIDHYSKIYSGYSAVEFMHIQDHNEREWIRTQFEQMKQKKFSKVEQIDLFERLLRAEIFEETLLKKFRTAKIYGCKGIEGMVPTLNALLQRAADQQVKYVTTAMAHRGRLNLLANILEIPMENLYGLFQSWPIDNEKDEGDMKYHLGRTVTRKFENGNQINICLIPNPSHLEAVTPVLYGKTKGKIINDYGGNKLSVLPVLLHGDGAFSGQGILYETVQMYKLKHFRIGGCIHIVTNNQIQFTSESCAGRSTRYATDLAKSFDCPVFHVNADQIEEAAKIAQLAVDYRQKFGKNVFIDLIGFRKLGHNEQDDPSVTNPKLYIEIAKHPGVVTVFKNKLVNEGALNDQTYKQLYQKWTDFYNQEAQKGKDYNYKKFCSYWRDKENTKWGKFVQQNKGQTVDSWKTGIPKKKLEELANKIFSLPKQLQVSKSVQKTYQERLDSVIQGHGINYGTAEALAFATLLAEGKSIRISGEDVSRGTFSHRHAKVWDQRNQDQYSPYENLAKNSGKFYSVNSHLSEYGVLGFEYGYSLTNPEELTIWEAQFGDFTNGGQIIVDQFVQTGERKWDLQTPFIILLPHGYEGLGSEHSNARPERFLVNSQDNPLEINEKWVQEKTQIYNNNIQVLSVSTPANYFHALRRQMHRGFRKPLAMFQTKRMLRSPISKIQEFENDQFVPLIPEYNKELKDDSKIRRLFICSSNISHELAVERDRKDPTTQKWHDDVAIIRLEQWAPLPYKELREQIKKYKNAEVYWIQEEHLNFSPWIYLQPRINLVLSQMGRPNLKYMGRSPSAVAATGYSYNHKKEYEDVLKNAFK